MTDNTPTEDTGDDTQMYEMEVTFVPRQRALIRIRATSQEMAESALRHMTEDAVESLTIEETRVVAEDAPVPPEYDASDPQTADGEQNVIPLKKTVH